MGFKIIKTKRKKRQYTKFILDFVIFLVLVTTVASIYINYKNGLGMDSVVSSCWDGLKYIIPSYCAKSFFETKEEKKNKILEDESEDNEDGI